MLQVISSSWALLLGFGLLMMGNGMQGPLLSDLGARAGFSTLAMSIVVSGYFVGVLVGGWYAPGMIRRVGHVRVFAALASLISAVMILYPALVHPVAWALGRFVVGFCFSGVYVTTESWLNNAADNENRGKALSAYMIVLTLGLTVSPALLLVDDSGGYLPFVIGSIAISISFAPILLSISPTPAFESSKPMTMLQLFHSSPLGCVGMFVLGGLFAAQFGMASVYAKAVGMSDGQIAIFTSSFFIGGLLFQFPLGWMSDRMDRRILVAAAAGVAGFAGLFASVLGGNFYLLVAAVFICGGLINPLYSLLIAHTNDHLDHDDMASASGSLVLLAGAGSSVGPIFIGWFMSDGVMGQQGFFYYIAVLLFALGGYSLYRITQRASVPVDETGVSTVVAMSASPVAMEFAQEYVIETELEEQEAAEAEERVAG